MLEVKGISKSFRERGKKIKGLLVLLQSFREWQKVFCG